MKTKCQKAISVTDLSECKDRNVRALVGKESLKIVSEARNKFPALVVPRQYGSACDTFRYKCRSGII